MNTVESGTMLPMTAALNTCPRRSQRANGRTAAVCEIVKGMSIENLAAN
jgi:hypothetical protein